MTFPAAEIKCEWLYIVNTIMTELCKPDTKYSKIILTEGGNYFNDNRKMLHLIEENNIRMLIQESYDIL